jgi:DNA repair protein RecO (recombination protein O)
MEWLDEAFVLGSRRHGESGAIVDFLTCEHGRVGAHVAGGASRRIRAFLEAGTRVRLTFRSRLEHQLGSAIIEPVGQGPSALFDDAMALAGLSAAASVAASALPDREPHAGAFWAFEALLAAFELPEIWPAVYVRFEIGLLEELGFGLDLSKCASSGRTDDLVYVSPRTGRAVSREAGLPFHDRMLKLPGFLLGSQFGVQPGDIEAGLILTAHFLESFVYGPLNRPLPANRVWMVDQMAKAGYL